VGKKIKKIMVGAFYFYFHLQNFALAILATAHKNLNNFIYAAKSLDA
jgi:hypothetical protein